MLKSVLTVTSFKKKYYKTLFVFKWPTPDLKMEPALNVKNIKLNILGI